MAGIVVGQHGALTRAWRDRAVTASVFLLLLAFSYSEDLIAVAFEITDRGTVLDWLTTLVGLDLAILAVVGVLKVVIARADDTGPRLWRWYWAAVAVTVAVDATLCLLPDEHPLAIDLAASVVFAVVMGVLMMVALNADPLTLVSATRRQALPTDWLRARAIVPLMIGTFACYLAATSFEDFFDLHALREVTPETVDFGELSAPLASAAETALCESAVGPAFLQQMVNFIPMVLLTLGVEFNFFRRTLAEPAQRAAAAATVFLLCTGLVLALSVTPWSGSRCSRVPSYWHEYAAFSLCVQGVVAGIAALIWLLVTSDSDRRGDRR